MAHESARMMLVRGRMLVTAPKAFQEYVSTYFKEQKIGDVSYYAAFLVLTLSHQNFRRGQGVAPAHASNVDYFGRQHGMGENESLYDWINKQSEENPQDIIEIYSSWDDGFASLSDND